MDEFETTLASYKRLKRADEKNIERLLAMKKEHEWRMDEMRAEITRLREMLDAKALEAAGAAGARDGLLAENTRLREALEVTLNDWEALSGTDSQPAWLRKQAGLNARALAAALYIEEIEEGR